MSPDALPPDLRRLILVCDAPHPRLGSPCWTWTGVIGVDGIDASCGWRRCCNPDHVEPAPPFTSCRTQPATAEGASA
jgi:hypothetical protein